MPNAVFVRDAAGVIVFENRASTEIRRLTAHPHPTAAQPPAACQAQQLANYYASDAQVLATGAALEAESTLTLASGEERHFCTMKRLLIRADGSRQVLGVSTCWA